MEDFDTQKMQGPSILARMGKKVLRPGGIQLTKKLIEAINIKETDNVLEFAPGIGSTARLLLNQNPQTYTGIEMNTESVAKLKRRVKHKNIAFINSKATESNLPDQQFDKVVCEAMLTMHADHRKIEIIKEAYRMLKYDGLLAIHELSIRQNFKDEKSQIQKELALYVKVNARPITEQEWITLLETEGFKILKIIKNPMQLLEIGRIIEDEGWIRTAKFFYNCLRNTEARNRILTLQHIFKSNKEKMEAVVIIAQKRRQSIPH